MSDQFTRYNKRQSLAGRVAKLQSEVEELWADCEQLKQERDAAIQRAKKAEDALHKIEKQIPTWGIETDFSDQWLEVERLIIEVFSPKSAPKGEANHEQ